MHCFKYTSSIITPRFVECTISLPCYPAPADLYLYHRADYPALTYSGRVRGNTRDVLLYSMLMAERVNNRSLYSFVTRQNC